MSGDDFSKRYDDALSAMEERYRRQRDVMDDDLRRAIVVEEARILDSLTRLLDDDGRAQAAEFRASMAETEAALGIVSDAAPTSLDDLEVRSLHLLAKLDSSLRHSIVEACLMNLRGFAEVLDERASDPSFLAKVGGQIRLLPGVAQQIVDFFQRPLAFGLAVRDLLPMAYKVALAGVRGVLWVADRFSADDASTPPVPGRELASRIDDLTAALTEVRKVLDAKRVSLGAAVGAGIEALRPAVEEAGGTLTFRDETDGSARLFLNEMRLANAVGELVRNAVKHGRDGASPSIRVTVSEDPVPATTLRVVVEDDGVGFAPEILAHGGEDALSTAGGGAGLTLVCEAAAEHFGSVELAGGPEGGACVTIRLPRHPPV